MRVPFLKEMRIGAYIFRQKLLGRKRYPLVLMLEPLFRCNLACVGCGKIDYPDSIRNSRRRAADPSRDRRDREGPGREKEVRLAVHECAAAGEEAAPVRALPLSVLLCPPRRA